MCPDTFISKSLVFAFVRSSRLLSRRHDGLHITSDGIAYIGVPGKSFTGSSQGNAAKRAGYLLAFLYWFHLSVRGGLMMEHGNMIPRDMKAFPRHSISMPPLGGIVHS